MASAFEIGDQRGEPRTDQAGTAGGCVEGCVVHLLALAAPARMGAKADDRDHFARQRHFDLLDDFGRQFARHHGAVAIRALDAMKIAVIDLVIRKDGRSCFGWPGCPPRFRFLPCFGGSLGFLTMSLEGGFDELVEFFLAAASSASTWQPEAQSCSCRRSQSAHPAHGCIPAASMERHHNQSPPTSQDRLEDCERLLSLLASTVAPSGSARSAPSRPASPQFPKFGLCPTLCVSNLRHNPFPRRRPHFHTLTNELVSLARQSDFSDVHLCRQLAQAILVFRLRIAPCPDLWIWSHLTWLLKFTFDDLFKRKCQSPEFFRSMIFHFEARL